MSARHFRPCAECRGDGMSRPDCYYCDGTGVLEDAVRVDVDDYRDAECGYCEGTGKALHSANTNTACPPSDALRHLARVRRFYRKGERDDGFSPYLNVKRHAIGRPVLARLRMVEAAIRCDVACRDAVQAWRRVA